MARGGGLRECLPLTGDPVGHLDPGVGKGEPPQQLEPAVDRFFGVVIALFQALTQIQEQTLVFVPKILAIFVTLLLALPFMADSLHSHMMRISSRIIGG